MKRKTQSGIMSKLDVVFAVGEEMVVGNGEDSFGYSFNQNGGILAVFDGCGGLGSRRYEQYNSKTGAYIASRAACEVLLKDWFCSFSERKGRVNNASMEQIKSEIFESFKLSLLRFKVSGSSLVKGSMTRELPTTTSIIMCDYHKNKLNTAFIWAGDSRGYILTSDGLAQVTSDDICGDNDAYANLSNDSRLENVIAADGNFRLNHKLLSMPLPLVAITVTDGCFGYYKTPMEFEYMLIDTMVASENVSDWKKILTESIRNVAGDDFSISLAAFGYNDFKKMKRSLVARGKFLFREYISKLEEASEEQISSMWQVYRKDYYRW